MTELQALQHVLSVTRAKEVHGTDCTEEDSTAIKAVMRTLDPLHDQRMISRLSSAWPLEWEEVQS